MNVKYILLAAGALMALPMAAQETYQDTKLVENELNGTARYVGMGGAMEALGADISTMQTNPAGIGLFRKSQFTLSGGFVSQSDVHNPLRYQNAQIKIDGDATKASFDQVGFVWAMRNGHSSFLNFGFNYHKSRNFDQILSAANSLRGASQNGLTYDKADRGIYNFDFNKQGEIIGYEGKDRSWSYSEADYMNANALMLDPDDASIYAIDADKYTFDRAHRGWIANYDFNVSGNVNDRFYWGLTVGVKDANYRGYSEYGESLVDKNGSCGSVVVGDSRKIRGTGLDLTAGIIVRPIEESPFRFGLSIKTPTWYDLTSSNSTLMENYSDYGAWDEGKSNESYDFKYYTPWEFGVSLGHTIGNQVALGAGYMFSDYSASKNRVNKGDRYWYDDYGYSPSYTDEPMERNTERSLEGVHTLKAGIEVKPVPEFGVRLGYNYVSAAYDKSGVRDMTLDSPGVSYASTTDYVNWGDTHRVTCGLGFKTGGFNVDLAYQYSTTKGDFYPFQPYAGSGSVGVSEVKNNRHQVLLTLGYTF